MPRIKKSRNRKEIQKTIIQTRLIEISLKVDKLIYKKVPIPIEDAKLYAQEIASYNILSTGDPRSLQVIEKLTSFMKKIIEEHTISNNKDDLQQDLVSDSKKPVTTPSENKPSTPNITHCHVADQISSDFITTDAKPTGINDSVVRDKEWTMDFIGDIDLDRTLSNLSLNCILDPLQNNTTCQFDDNVKSLKDTKPNDTEHSKLDTTNNENFTTITQTVNVNNSAYIPKDTTVITYMNNLQNPAKPPGVIKPMQHISHELDRNLEILGSNLNTDANRSQLDKPIIPKHTKNIIPNTNTSKPIKTNTSRKKNKNDNTNPNSEVTLKRTKKNIQQSIGKRKLNSKEAKPKRNIRTKSKKGSIFNNTDLSWIEDIKYVRKINADEFDPTLDNLEDSFWHNSNLPLNWDEYCLN